MNEAADSGPGYVLVVEDNREVALLLERVLAREGYLAVLVTDGASAVDLLEARAISPRALMVDLLLPGWRGDIVAERARAIHPDLPIIFMSGMVREESLGPLPPRTAFLLKPFTLQALRATLDGLLRPGAGPP